MEEQDVSPEREDVRDAALEYVRKGWKVLPLHSVNDDGFCSCGNYGCTSPGKHPRNITGSRGASNDPGWVEKWWNEWPDANVGIATGEGSSLVVVDADGVSGLDSLVHLNLPQSLTVETGSGGRHIYYSWPDGSHISNSVRKIADGVDVRGEGGYVVAPPSVHVNGRYTWLNKQTVSPAPDILKSQRASYEPVEVTGAIPAGERNNVLVRVAGLMQRAALGEEVIYAALSKLNEERCVPQLGDSEVRGIARNISRYPSEEPLVVPSSRLDDFKIWTAQELRDLVLPTQDQVVGPLLIRGSRLVVAGHTGEGKTTFGLQLVHAAVTGAKFFRWRGSGSAKVLVLDAEQGLRTIQRRLAEAGLEGPYPHYIRVPDGLNLDDDSEALLIEEILAANRYDVLVLDPLYKLHKGELTDERVSVDLMRRLDAWRERYNFALLILAHCRKPAPGVPFTIHDVFGSTAVLRGAEVVLGLQRVIPGESLLHFFKDRDGDLPVGEAWELTFDQMLGFGSPMQDLWDRQDDDDSMPGLWKRLTG